MSDDITDRARKLAQAVYKIPAMDDLEDQWILTYVDNATPIIAAAIQSQGGGRMTQTTIRQQHAMMAQQQYTGPSYPQGLLQNSITYKKSDYELALEELNAEFPGLRLYD